MARFFIDDIKASEFLKVTLFFADGFLVQPQKIEGYLVDDTFSLDSTATWADMGDETYSSIVGEFAGDLANKIVQKGLKFLGISDKPLLSTIQQWEESERPEFDVGLLFIHTKNDDPKSRPEETVSYLNARCYPKFLGGMMVAPMKYQPFKEMAHYVQYGTYKGNYETGGYSPVTGTITLKIGKWFLAPNLLLRNSSFEFSKECAPDGSPIYAQGKVQLTTARAISFEEYLNYFLLIDKSWKGKVKAVFDGEYLGKKK